MLHRRNVPGRFMAGNVRQRRRRCCCYRSSATAQTTFHPYARHQSGVVVRTLLDGRNFRNCYRAADLVQRMFRCALALRDSLTPTPNDPPDCDSREAMVRGRLRPSVVREVRENIQRRRIRALERPSSVGDGLNPADRHCIAAPARKCRQCPSQACGRHPHRHCTRMLGHVVARVGRGWWCFPWKAGAPDWIRTSGLCLRRAALYPAELRVPVAPD